ncbi:YdeI/OmpD-associated family protein [Flavihumibacter rivuli]|uniref:YdeI/OmpD-associated family protein n=1 Tax=Flavihumibacter rivuli TaxID=2838156 RepID=UPI001BDEF39F|nr:YdeI/OmpD-associated family protein [Flavihumibacter rivuli]ULQ55788.1 YdeI/OmpD-associated family protein [Flavihumibacter rivuli]
MQQKPILHKKVQLEKFPGKGGWTYARIPEILQDPHSPFGWVRVNGSIDGVELQHYHLMPMGNGQLFLPVKSAIRKKIKKEAGDWIEVILYADTNSIDVPPDFLECLQDEPAALAFFQSLPETEQLQWIKWIGAVSLEEKRIERMAKAVNDLARKIKSPN